MKTVVTGANGFIGKNLIVALQRAQVEVAQIDADSSLDAWVAAVSGAGVVFHLAGVNRPTREGESFAGNVESLVALFTALDKRATRSESSRPLVVLSSSTQATCD